MAIRPMAVCISLSTIACATEAGFEIILRKNRNLTMAVHQAQPLSRTGSMFNKASKRVINQEW
ncbi:hypothetical protein BCR44DRAFT_1440923 [Catenaria anguillulae PL171]|uniref:Uncharacterized protein n=1 Tax=Catenaria anguillulae PL171 TaxID=765915 RepID=A0A1Y2HC81_9FUNG|nr:hypothetical protein BCR44DRAFT_1440923 [Catenaria anguillulae PL171]